MLGIIHEKGRRRAKAVRQKRGAGLLMAIVLTGLTQGPCIANGASSGNGDQPNIIVILADDMGYSDSGAFGGEIRTPSCDRLAATGRFVTQFYNTARCCPTRASLMTGLYPHQAGIGHLIYKTPHPGYSDFLSPNSITIPEVLRQAGYRTYMSGKWHLAPRSYDPEEDLEHWPLRRGFDKFYGTIAGSGSYWDPLTLARGETLITPENDPQYRPETFYYTNAITDNAIAFIEQHEKESGEKPFFLYMAYTSPHWPLHAPEEAIAEYSGKYDAGYEVIHARRVGRLRELGLIPEVGDIADPVGNWDGVKNKDSETSLMETFAAMVTCMDEGIGHVVDYLREKGELDNTMIVFLQDNGACAEDWFSMDIDPERQFPPMGPDDLQGQYRPRQTRDGRPVRMGPNVKAGPADTYTAYKENWANVSNAPFRKYKHYVYEGGISSPLIISWPAGLGSGDTAGPIRVPAHLIDLMPTFLEVAGASYPDQRQDVDLQPAEGVSLLPALKGSGPLERANPLFFEHESNRAVRDGKWKIVAIEGEPWELYDLSVDRGEMKNLAEVYPREVARLADEWYRWAKRAKVLPLGGWRDKGYSETNLFLQQGEQRGPEASPLLAGEGISASIRVLQGPVEGVLLSQGSRSNGFCVYAESNTLTLLMRRNGKAYRLSLDEIPRAPFTVNASLSSRGRAILGIDDRRMDTRFGDGIQENPGEGISAGLDVHEPVGDYSGSFPFQGRLGFVMVRGILNE